MTFLPFQSSLIFQACPSGEKLRDTLKIRAQGHRHSQRLKYNHKTIKHLCLLLIIPYNYANRALAESSGFQQKDLQ